MCSTAVLIESYSNKYLGFIPTLAPPKKDLLTLKKEDWKNLSKEKFDEIFEGSAVKRTGFKGLKRNIEFIKKSDQTPPK